MREGDCVNDKNVCVVCVPRDGKKVSGSEFWGKLK